MPQKKSVPKVCEVCGDVFLVRPVDARRHPCRFCSRSCKGKAQPPISRGLTGEDNPNWKGGLTFSKSTGYWRVLQPTHQRADHLGYVKRADLVLEEKLGRPLLPNEIAHHVNEDRADDSPENLECMDYGEHRLMHIQQRAERARQLNPPKPKQPDHPSNRRYTWPSDSELLEMRKTMSLRQIAAIVGCGHKTVDRRLSRISSSR